MLELFPGRSLLAIFPCCGDRVFVDFAVERGSVDSQDPCGFAFSPVRPVEGPLNVQTLDFLQGDGFVLPDLISGQTA